VISHELGKDLNWDYDKWNILSVPGRRDIHGHLWHRYSVAVYQVMVMTVIISKRWLQL